MCASPTQSDFCSCMSGRMSSFHVHNLCYPFDDQRQSSGWIAWAQEVYISPRTLRHVKSRTFPAKWEMGCFRLFNHKGIRLAVVDCQVTNMTDHFWRTDRGHRSHLKSTVSVKIRNWWCTLKDQERCLVRPHNTKLMWLKSTQVIIPMHSYSSAYDGNSLMYEVDSLFQNRLKKVGVYIAGSSRIFLHTVVHRKHNTWPSKTSTNSSHQQNQKAW